MINRLPELARTFRKMPNRGATLVLGHTEKGKHYLVHDGYTDYGTFQTIHEAVKELANAGFYFVNRDTHNKGISFWKLRKNIL